ncbi:MAG: site-specific integrase [Bacillota bacterium]
MTVSQSLHYGENGYHFNGTKNYMGRVIEIGEDVVKVLRKHKKDQEEKGIPNRYGLVFLRQNGMPHRRESISGMFIEYARRNGFNDIFHGLRHTHATLLIMSGVPVPTVRDRLGHSENSTTLNIYTHAVPSMQSKATRVFDEIIKKAEVLNEEESKAVQQVDSVDLFNVRDAFGLAMEPEVNRTGQGDDSGSLLC